jgi:hypothetical protein
MAFDGTVQAAHAKKTGITTPVFFWCVGITSLSGRCQRN